MAAQAYPLSWPVTVPRTPAHQRKAAVFHAIKREQRRSFDGKGFYDVQSKRDRTISECVDELQQQVKRFGAQQLVISTNLVLRLDGLPKSGQRMPEDPGVAVYFTLRGVPYCLPCDRWTHVEDNLWAVAKHLDAMRGMERWGVGSVEQQFLGYKALTAVAGSGEDCWMVLGLEPMSPADAVNTAHRRLAGAAHPDRGGSNEAMSRLNTARDAALAALKAAQ